MTGRAGGRVMATMLERGGSTPEQDRRQSLRSSAAGGGFLFARTAGEADEVLVELEPDPVVAVDSRRGHEPVVPTGGGLQRATEPDAVVGQPAEALGLGD